MHNDELRSKLRKPLNGFTPMVRAYALAYLYSISPKVIRLVAALLQGKQSSNAISELRRCLQQAAALNRFPSFCAVLVGGSTLLQKPVCWTLRIALRNHGIRNRLKVIEVLSRFLSAFGAAALGFVLLNSRTTRSRTFNVVEAKQVQGVDTNQGVAQSNEGIASDEGIPSSISRIGSYPIAEQAMSSHSLSPQMIPLAGRTLDLTLFALIRALDVLVRTVPFPKFGFFKSKTVARMDAWLPDPMLFAFSSGIIMWSWFYKPHRLPRSYASWVASAAQVDPRLVEALRQARYGNFVYGKDTGMAPLLGEMCTEYGIPEEWGDPARTVPIPCELYHMGTGPSCEWHAATRFARAWWLAMKLYLPLNLLVLLKGKRLSGRQAMRSFLNATRSSAFLGAFVGLFYLSVCLARTRIGPKLFSAKRINPMMWDSGICVGAGCVTCGWSILLETRSRRQEIAFFVAPRAAATVLPRWYDRKYLWREHVIFAFSAAIVLTAAQDTPKRVRGVFGKLLHWLLKQD